MFLSFSLNVCIHVRSFCDWLDVYRYVSWAAPPPPSLSVCLCLSQCPCILPVICMYMNRCVQLSQGVIVVQKIIMMMFILFLVLCVYNFWCLLVRICVSVCFWMSVTVSGYIMTHCMSIYCSALCLCVSFALNICSAILALIVRIYVCLLMRVSLWISAVVLLTFFLSASISVRVCCHWLYVYRYLSWSAFLSLCLSQCPGILLVNMRVYVRLLIRISLSLNACSTLLW